MKYGADKWPNVLVAKLDVGRQGARADRVEEDKVDKEVGKRGSWQRLILGEWENSWQWGGRNKEPAHDTCPMVISTLAH